MSTHELILDQRSVKSQVKLGNTKSEVATEQLSPFDLYMGNQISYRLYRDTRPHCLEIAPLQKGLVLILRGKELIEEGVGFGVPVVKYEDKTYFSSSATSFLFYDKKDRPVLTKCFDLNAISRKRIGQTSYVNDGFYSLIHKLFEKAYLNSKKLTPALNMIMELRRTLRVQTDFIRVKSRGTIAVVYTCLPEAIKVGVDFSDLKREGCREILVLNEQGSSFFSEYSDTDGLFLSDRNIGAWEKVEAEGASLSGRQGTLTFTLRNARASRLFRGWERTRGRFSWTGLNYSLLPSASTFDYGIQLKKTV